MTIHFKGLQDTSYTGSGMESLLRLLQEVESANPRSVVSLQLTLLNKGANGLDTWRSKNQTAVQLSD
jgi:hypothetical protein